MTGTAIKISVKDQEVQGLLKRIRARLGSTLPAMKTIGEIVRTSVIRNFEKGGRPDAWAEHSETTQQRRGDNAAVLRKQGMHGGLMASINVDAKEDFVSVGTDKKYAAVHQFGAAAGSFGAVAMQVRAHLRKTASGRDVPVRAHTRKAKLPWGDIPARPFLMVQDEDWIEIRAALNDYLTHGA